MPLYGPRARVTLASIDHTSFASSLKSVLNGCCNCIMLLCTAALVAAALAVIARQLRVAYCLLTVATYSGNYNMLAMHVMLQ